MPLPDTASNNFVDGILLEGDKMHYFLSKAIGKLGSRLSLEEIKDVTSHPKHLKGIEIDFGGIISGDIFGSTNELPFHT